ncbi:MAG: DUF6122 family protein [Bacteroidota bacterium]
MLRHFVHYGIHFLVPIVIALLFYKDNKVKVILILLAGILLDIDHVFAHPIFDSDRCSIGFHPLHAYVLIPVYFGLVFWKKTRLLGLALVIHIIADVTDCLFIGF